MATSSAWPRTRPDLIRSWATDIAGAADPDYEWHDLAKVWQTPGDGEAAVEMMSAMPVDQRAAAFVGVGMTDSGGAVVRRGSQPGDGPVHPRPLSLGGTAGDDRVGT